MAVLVTGGAGYVGFNVVEELLGTGRQVVLFDRGSVPAPAQRAIAPYAKQLTVVQGDICDAGGLKRLHERYQIEGIIHCAAMTSGSEREARDPVSVVNINLNGTVNVLDAARQAGVRRVVYANSGSVYGETLYKGLPRLYEETCHPVPVRLYSITKQAAERTCLRMRELWNLDVVSARLGNVIGPWERDTGVRDRFEPHSQIVSCAASGNTAILPQREISRDLVYSRDVAAGLIMLLDAPAPRHAVYNLSSGQVWGATLAAWCEALKTVYPDFRFRVAAEGETPNITYSDQERSLMDMGRMANELGFRPREQSAVWADFIEWIRRTPDFWQA
jgi:nucleoside-diphosphate-sugar epimerase